MLGEYNRHLLKLCALTSFANLSVWYCFRCVCFFFLRRFFHRMVSVSVCARARDLSDRDIDQIHCADGFYPMHNFSANVFVHNWKPSEAHNSIFSSAKTFMKLVNVKLFLKSSFLAHHFRGIRFAFRFVFLYWANQKIPHGNCRAIVLGRAENARRSQCSRKTEQTKNET